MAMTGGCLCGNIRYEIEGPAMAAMVCHCKNCQRQSGAAFSVNVVVKDDALTLTGDLSTFEDRGESGGTVFRRFCATCGSPILSALGSLPGISIMKAGTLDETSAVAPSAEVWCDSKQAWLKSADVLPAFPKNPPS